MSADSTNPKPPRRARRPGWWPWHQRLGLGFAVVFLGVIVTGIALNHTEGLDLDGRAVPGQWLYDWYDLSPEGEPVAFDANGWAVSWDGLLTWNDHVLGASGPLRGAAKFSASEVLLLSDHLWVITPAGDVIERLRGASLPPGKPRRLGRTVGPRPVVIETSDGIYHANLSFAEWTPMVTRQAVVWADPVTLSVAGRDTVQQAHRGRGLSWYRVILDLHSGRFFGSVGVWVVDASAVALAFLTLTGTWYALRIKRP
ncbi:PepSY domain-containing protein [Synoicihabitans lomoniglobus]|uniref:PepSY domain-containing protein n=1 Tax=Synoicihabitans lomoniglobus TaxID=2909285 RepID=A0AAF0CQQ1_9BACT|nr:PepSY domain-containing protein [Opitutaceae bacterium LMO-M01]WED66324.1 PepSY domain-containing protein [Opitutaceae bacterium LMO-M01]